MHVDPKAPGDSPFHPSNLHKAQETPEQQADRELVEWLNEVVGTHMTDSEWAAADLPDGETLRDTMRLRVDALVEYLEAVDHDPGAAPPEIIDLTGQAHVLEVDDDGQTARWVPVEDDGDGYDDLTVPQLVEVLKGRELPHSGNKPDLIARLRENDALSASPGDQPDEKDTEQADDDLEAALAALDATKRVR